jgi:hypothetical protein
MLTLKKLFIREVHDICPNCGEACAITDILCPKCGKNLDELFEKLPDLTSSTFIAQKWMILFMNEKVTRIWRIMNSLILIIAFVAPWEVVYSDMLPSEPFTIIGLKVFLFSIPIELSYMFFLDCLSCVAGGLIAIGYLSLVLYTILNFIRVSLRVDSHNKGLRKASFIFVFVSSLFLLQVVTPMILTALAWGYWLACAGFLSSLWLEVTEWISRKPFVVKLSSKAAQHSVHPTGGSLRVFKHFAWLGVDSAKMVFSRPAHQRVTPAVRRWLNLVILKVGCQWSFWEIS